MSDDKESAHRTDAMALGHGCDRDEPGGGGTSPSTTPDTGDAAGGTQLGEPLKTAAEVVASRLTETVEKERATAQGAGGDVPVRGGGQITGDVAGMIRRYPAASMLMGLGMGFGIGLLVGRRRGQTITAAGA